MTYIADFNECLRNYRQKNFVSLLKIVIQKWMQMWKYVANFTIHSSMIMRSRIYDIWQTDRNIYEWICPLNNDDLYCIYCNMTLSHKQVNETWKRSNGLLETARFVNSLCFSCGWSEISLTFTTYLFIFI